MAVIHRASLVPSKLELIDRWLAKQPWGGETGELERVGSYRFDDPAGEVGIEGFLATRGEAVFHVLLTYRGEPLEGAEEWLVGTMEHSVLGTRWAYDGVGDPVAVAALVRAARREQEQALLEVHDGGAVVGQLEPDVRIRAVAADGDSVSDVSGPEVAEVMWEGARLRIARVVGARLLGHTGLVAAWSRGEAAIAALV